MRRLCWWSLLLAGTAFLAWEMGCQPGAPAESDDDRPPPLATGAIDAGPTRLARAGLSPSADPH
jgi:hypothetical protein